MHGAMMPSTGVARGSCFLRKPEGLLCPEEGTGFRQRKIGSCKLPFSRDLFELAPYNRGSETDEFAESAFTFVGTRI